MRAVSKEAAAEQQRRAARTAGEGPEAQQAEKPEAPSRPAAASTEAATQSVHYNPENVVRLYV